MSDPTPGTEGYWEALSSDGGASSLSPTEVLDGELDAKDRVHSVLVTGRTQEELYLLVSRSTTHDSGRDVIDLRTFIIELDTGNGYWTGNGLWVPATTEVAKGLTRSIVRLGNDYPDDSGGAPVLVSGLLENGGDPVDRGRELMTTPIDRLHQRDDQEKRDYSKTSVETDEDVETVECSECGATIEKETAENFGGGVVDVWVCSGPCVNGGD